MSNWCNTHQEHEALAMQLVAYCLPQEEHGSSGTFCRFKVEMFNCQILYQIHRYFNIKTSWMERKENWQNVFLRECVSKAGIQQSVFICSLSAFVCCCCLLKKNRYSEKFLLPRNKPDTRVLEGKVHFRLQWEHQESLLPMSTCQCQCQHEDILKTRF